MADSSKMVFLVQTANEVEGQPRVGILCHVSRKDGLFRMTSPGLPGWEVTSEQRETMQSRAQAALQVHIDTLLAAGLPLPEPASMKDIQLETPPGVDPWLVTLYGPLAQRILSEYP